MRRAAALVLAPVIAGLALAGCSSSSSSSSSAAVADANKAVTVTGALNQAPTVVIPKAKGSGELVTKTLIQGSGAPFTSESTQAVLGNYVVYDWSGTTSKELGTSYGSGAQSIFTGALLSGLKTAMVGQKMGSRVLAVIPPKDGFGSTGTSQGIGANDTLVFVVDLNTVFPSSVTAKQTSDGGGALPTVTPPPAGSTTTGPVIKINNKATPPTTLQVKTLAKGTGPAVTSGQSVVVQYTGMIWRNSQVFDSSWPQGQPRSLSLTQLIPGWKTGMVGQTVGSRVLMVLPPAEAYGKAGQSQAGIKGTDTLVFVVDLLAAY